VLLASIMLNLFFLSFLGIRYAQNRSPVCIDRRITINGLIASLPREDQKKFAQVLQQDKPRYWDQLLAIGVKRAALDKAVLAPEFALDRVQADFRDWQVSWNDFMTVFGMTLIDATARISPQGRQALIQAFPNHPHCN